MSDYLQAKEALDKMFRELNEAKNERDALMDVVRMVASESVGGDALLACQNIVRITNRAMKVWEERR